MDIFTLEDNNVNSYDNGLIVGELKSKLWVERFVEPGEFSFTAVPTEYILDVLKLGTLISHTNTQTVMRVEDHEITADAGQEPQLIVTGRSIDGFMEQRVATDDDMGFDPSLNDGSQYPYTMPEALPWNQALKLMRDQMGSAANRAQFTIPWFTMSHDIVVTQAMRTEHPDWFDQDEREVKRGPLSAAVIAILHEIDAGIRIVRPTKANNNIQMIVTMGKDKTKSVQFSYEAGDIDTARYYWSNKGFRNAAYVQSRYQSRYVFKSGPTGWTRSVAFVDANDINVNPDDFGWGGPAKAAQIDNMLKRRGNIRIRRAKNTEIVEATISRNTAYKFREDYDVGDQVWVRGNYGVSKALRVTEFAESEDETGEFGFPTLGSINV